MSRNIVTQFQLLTERIAVSLLLNWYLNTLKKRFRSSITSLVRLHLPEVPRSCEKKNTKLRTVQEIDHIIIAFVCSKYRV